MDEYSNFDPSDFEQSDEFEFEYEDLQELYRILDEEDQARDC